MRAPRGAGTFLPPATLLALSVLACSERTPYAASGTIRRDSVGVEIVENRTGPDVGTWHVGASPIAVIGGDESDPDGQLFRALSATRLDDGVIAVGDAGTSRVLVFGIDGARLRAFGGRGGGPGEISGLVGMRVLPGGDDEILVEDLDFRQRKLMHFSRAGELRDEAILPPGTLPGGALVDQVTSAGGVGFLLVEPLPVEPRGDGDVVRPPMSLVRFTYAGEGPDTVATYPGSEILWADVGPRPALGGGSTPGPSPIAPLFAASTRMGAGGTPWRLVVGDQATAAYDVYDEEGTLLRRVRWDATPRTLTERDVRLGREAWLEAPSRRRAPARARRRLDAMPPPERTPVFREIAVDRTGHVWVRPYDLPTDSTQEWWVFGPDGSLAATVALPPELGILEIGADYVIGRATDALDVERIEVWPLERSGARDATEVGSEGAARATTGGPGVRFPPDQARARSRSRISDRSFTSADGSGGAGASATASSRRLIRLKPRITRNMAKAMMRNETRALMKTP